MSCDRPAHKENPQPRNVPPWIRLLNRAQTRHTLRYSLDSRPPGQFQVQVPCRPTCVPCSTHHYLLRLKRESLFAFRVPFSFSEFRRQKYHTFWEDLTAEGTEGKPFFRFLYYIRNLTQRFCDFKKITSFYSEFWLFTDDDNLRFER